MTNLLTLLIKRPRIIHLLLLFVFLVGIVNLITIKRVGYPRVDFGIVSVTTVYPGASAEDVELEFNSAAIRAVAELASNVNNKMENIGARRLHTIMSTLLEDPLFEHPKRGQKKIKITAKVVKESLAGILEDPDLSRYIL